ncbi:MAG: UDP-N-acetylglucosamine 2-epimerase [Gammaproteobacteria bacterium]|jgi:UDP-hydrolysing UDP-N-acetyl-D-glucosamine 2-epimerase|nr:UDP-N-acetylglucosamine 2-epimerase [Gammaproteobacteria bacterium]|tara:strand:- start:4553 stop:5728 length:1176 start_codon:yes stop_codon:yes gene_type:complete
MKRKVCVVTGSRAEYGLLYWILRDIQSAPDLELQLLVTGMHLSAEFGMTMQQIKEDGFEITQQVEMLLSSDSAVGVTKSTGLGMIGFADAFDSLAPDIVLMLGDRFELLAAASAALFAVIPIAHIHGGEVTTGAFDDAIRHSITKMAQLHFTSTETYRNRVIQLGEDPDKVFNVGAPGLDSIHRMKLMEKPDLEVALGLELGSRSLLVTFHPVTLEPGRAVTDFRTLLSTLDELEDISLVFTKANADTEGRAINRMIDDYIAIRSSAVVHTSLGQLKYLSTLKHVSGVVGNSSSGIIEAPSLKVGTINIGERQKGRVQAANVIDCEPTYEDIRAALVTLFSSEFQQLLSSVVNPHGSGDVAGQIVRLLQQAPLADLKKKQFHDWPLSRSSE